MKLSGVTVPIEFVLMVVTGLVGAIGWLARRYDRANARAVGLRTDRREAAIMLRESLRERDPDLEPISFDDDSAILEIEYKKDKARVVKHLSLHPPPKEDDRAVAISPRIQRRLERFARTGDPSTPPDPPQLPPESFRIPRKKLPSRSG